MCSAETSTGGVGVYGKEYVQYAHYVIQYIQTVTQE